MRRQKPPSAISLLRTSDCAIMQNSWPVRVRPHLARPVTLDWQVCELPTLPCLTPQNVLHVLRIVQEAITNALKHARAKHIRVATAFAVGRVSIEVSDDGCGFDGTKSAEGHGLDNMRRRAKLLGGDLWIAPKATGTTLSLSIPVGRDGRRGRRSLGARAS